MRMRKRRKRRLVAPNWLPSFLISAHLLFNLTLSLPIASYRMLLNMHINAHACSHIGSHLLPDEKMPGDRSRCIIPLQGPIKEMKSTDGGRKGRPKKGCQRRGDVKQSIVVVVADGPLG